MLSGCMASGGGFTNKGVGTVLGGAAGGILGNQIGKGTGKTVATAVGAVIGAAAGSAVGESMDNPRTVVVERGRPVNRYSRCDGYDNEGVRYTDPKLKVMGLEAVKSSTPQVCREKIKNALKVIMTGTE